MVGLRMKVVSFRGESNRSTRQYSVCMTNRGSGNLTEYGYRWEIESGYKSITRFMVATTSKDVGLRFFYSRLRVCCTRSGGQSIYSSKSS